MSSTPPTTDRSERRGKLAAVPENTCALLNQKQKNALREVESLGWELAFVRRPIMENPTFVVTDANRSRYAVVERDGQVNMDAAIRLRY